MYTMTNMDDRSAVQTIRTTGVLKTTRIRTMKFGNMVPVMHQPEKLLVHFPEHMEEGVHSD